MSTTFLLAISFYILAKSGFYVVIFKEALEVALSRFLRNRRKCMANWQSRKGVGVALSAPN
jgi:hypothetical protein